MEFEKKLVVDKHQMQISLGYKTQQPDENIQQQMNKAVNTLELVQAPKWNFAQFALQTETTTLEPSGITLEGSDIAAHLKGCTACILLAVTIGAKVEQVIRAAQATDLQQGILLDLAASTLTEQYANFAQEIIAEKVKIKGLYLTSRYSAGYGDFPLGMQPELLRLLNAQRTIGLTCNENFLLMPRKSVTAVIGVADHAVKGKLAGCEHCALREKCGGSCLCSA